MPSEPGPGRARLSLKVWVPLCLAVLVLAVLPAGLAGAAPVAVPAPTAVAAPGHSAAISHPSTSVASSNWRHSTSTPSRLTHPLTGSGTIEYFGNTTGFAQAPASQGGCTVYSGTGYDDNYCYPQAVDPTLVNLGNGNIGIGYQFSTNATGSTCSSAPTDAHTAVGFSVSTTGGTSFGAPTVIANTTCAFLQAIEPAFATSGDSVFGAFVEENYTANTPQSYGAYGGTMPGDALGFVSSSNDGASFSAVRTLVTGGNITHPEMATFGNSIYIVYENMSSSATTVPTGGPFCFFCAFPPGEIEYLYSTDGGSTWTGPSTLPGLNATVNGFSISAAIAVNSAGEVAVSYFTNESCGMYYYGSCYDYTLDLVLVTSTTNGSAWNGPYTVASNVGISNSYFCCTQQESGYWVPQDQLVFNSAGDTLYFAYSGLYNKSFTAYYYDDWCCAGIFFATGAASGGPFTTTPIYTSYDPNTYDDMFSPSIALNSGSLYISWTWNNESYCYAACDYLTGTLNQRLVTSSDGGTTWSDPFIVGIDKGGAYCTSACAFGQQQGYQSSIAFSGTTPLIAYAFPRASTYQSNYWGGVSYFNITYPTTLSVGFPYSGPTVVLNVTANNLPLGTTWTFNVQGLTYSATGSNFLITNIPVGQPVTISPNSLPAAYGEQITPSSSVDGVVTLSSNGSVFFNYSTEFQFIFFEEPAVTPYTEVYFDYNGSQSFFYSDWYCFGGSCYTYREWCDATYNCQNSPESWWFPIGALVVVTDQSYSSVLDSYWNGTGLGSFTGNGLGANITMNAPINETGWVGGFGLFNETFNAVGLPSTSTYSFDFNGGSYSAASTEAVIVPNVQNGPYSATGIQATSSTAGWEYFGTPNPSNPVIVPAEPIVNLTFAYVNVGAAMGTVTFHAVGLTDGTVWHFSFNGTEYSSSTPWINVTAHPGTYSTQAYPVVAANGSAGYAPSGVPSTWSVTTGSSYDVTYSAAFQVVATAGTGGSITGTGRGTLWLSNGAAASFHAVPGAGYEFGGWTGTGLNAYTGQSYWANFTVAGPAAETASFFPLPSNRYNLTFQETGLAPGTWWTVFLGTAGYSADTPSLVVHNLYPCSAGSLGTYNLTIPYAYVNGSSLTRYSPGGYHSTVCTSGSTLVPVGFSAQYYLTLGGTSGGVAQASIGANTYSSSLWVQNGSSVLLGEVPAPGYNFLGWNGSGTGSYTGSTPNVGIVMANPMSEIAAFAKPYTPPPPRYWVDFHLAAAFAPGTAWTVHVGTTGYSTSGTDLNVTGLLAQPAPYSVTVSTAYSTDGLTRYSPVGAPTALTVSHNQSVTLSFSTSYWVSVTANFGGSIVQPSSGAAGSWISSGLTLTINASAMDGYVFLGWTGTGSGSYTGPDSTTSIPVKGPIVEVAAFGPAPPAAKVVTSSIWTEPTTWIGLAVVGLVVGLVIGLLVGRRGGGGPRPAVSDAAWSEGPVEGGGEMTTEPGPADSGGN